VSKLIIEFVHPTIKLEILLMLALNTNQQIKQFVRHKLQYNNDNTSGIQDSVKNR